MLIDLNRYAAAICPECSNAALTPVSPFDVSVNHTLPITCISKACDTKLVTIAFKNKKYKITLECPFCGDTHSFTVTPNKMWRPDLLTLFCPTTGFPVFFFGEQEKVREGLERGFAGIEQLLKSTLDEVYSINDLINEDDFEYDEDDILYDILDELYELQCGNSLSCICGSEHISITPVDGSVLLSCKRCRRSKRLDIDDKTLAMIINASAIIIGR